VLGADGVEDAAPNLEAEADAAGSMADLLQLRSQLGQELQDYMLRHVCMPQLLGSGNASLPKKVGLLLHIFWMMLGPPRLRALVATCANIVSFTTDMGTELGLWDFEACGFGSVLPGWVSHS
jgi:hypothetical protein